MKTSKQALSGEEFFVSARDICSWHWICVGFCLMMREYWASNVGEAGKSLYNGGERGEGVVVRQIQTLTKAQRT